MWGEEESGSGKLEEGRGGRVRRKGSDAGWKSVRGRRSGKTTTTRHKVESRVEGGQESGGHPVTGGRRKRGRKVMREGMERVQRRNIGEMYVICSLRIREKGMK